MDLYTSTTADLAKKVNAGTLMSGSDVIDLTGVIAPTEDIVFPDSASHDFVSSGTHTFTIEAGDVILWFSGGHYGDYNKVSWSFVENVTPPNTMVLNCGEGLGYDWSVQVFRSVGPSSSLQNVSGGWIHRDKLVYVPGAIAPTTFVKPFQLLSASLNTARDTVMKSNNVARQMPDDLYNVPISYVQAEAILL